MLALPTMVAAETAHLYSFRSKISHAFALMGFTSADECRERRKQAPMIVAMTAGGSLENHGVGLLSHSGNHVFISQEMFVDKTTVPSFPKCRSADPA